MSPKQIKIPDSLRNVETPLMKQYMHIKAKHPDAILLFRVGDFYETFGEDAIKASEILGITLHAVQMVRLHLLNWPGSLTMLLTLIFHAW